MSEGSNWSMQCINGHGIEGEAPDTAIEDRRPCPECGTTARAISVSVGEAIETKDAVVRPKTIEVQTQFYPPSVRDDLLDRVAALHLDITLRWYEPSGPGGSWTFHAIDADSETIAMAENPEWQDAALAILDQLEPRRRESP